jgi:hypothetical protein
MTNFVNIQNKIDERKFTDIEFMKVQLAKLSFGLNVHLFNLERQYLCCRNH